MRVMTNSHVSLGVDILLHWAHAARASALRFTAKADGTTAVSMRVGGTLQPVGVSGVQHRDVIDAISARCSHLPSSGYNKTKAGSFPYTLKGGERVHVRFAALPISETPSHPIATVLIVYPAA